MRSLLLIGLVLSFNLWAIDLEKIDLELSEFETNPKAYLQKIPSKTQVVPNRIIPVDLKQKSHEQIIKQAQLGSNKSVIRSNERPEALVYNASQLERNIVRMHEQKLQQARLAKVPWAGYYFPFAKGILANRYEFESSYSMSWKDLYDNYSKNPASLFLQRGEGHLLSPAEKYDLLLSKNEFNLTQYMWNEGKYYYDRSGEVELWMGICHGWAIAAIKEAEPLNAVEIIAKNSNEKVIFYPHDIKGLASQLWADGNFATAFVGGRCNTKEPKLDENGRIIDQECFDINPGSWHMVVVNQIGIVQESFILDATFDYQVWNQPVVSYKYAYFNPETKKSSMDLKSSIIEIKNFKSDYFKKYRSPHAMYVVGVAMHVSYVVESSPTHEVGSYNPTSTARYKYDLELDAEFNIIGGEWYHNLHPDFLWVATKNASLSNVLDQHLVGFNWALGSKFNESQVQLLKAGAKQGQLSKVLIRKIIDKSAE
jgi:hypothetical protein